MNTETESFWTLEQLEKIATDIEGVDTLTQQLQIARQKAGIAPFEPVQLFYFQVERHH